MALWMTTRGHPNPRKRRPDRCREPRPLRPPPGDAVPGSAPVAPTPGRAGRAPFCLQGNSPRTVRTSRQVFRTGGRGGRGGRGGGRAGSRKVRKRNAAAAVPGCRPAASRSPVLEAPPWPPGAERRKDTFGLDLPGSAESDALWPPNGSLGTAGRRTAQVGTNAGLGAGQPRGRAGAARVGKSQAEATLGKDSRPAQVHARGGGTGRALDTPSRPEPGSPASLPHSAPSSPCVPERP